MADQVDGRALLLDGRRLDRGLGIERLVGKLDRAAVVATGTVSPRAPLREARRAPGAFTEPVEAELGGTEVVAQNGEHLTDPEASLDRGHDDDDAPFGQER